MFILARFTRFKAGEYRHIFWQYYANTVLSNLDWNIVYTSACEWLVCVVCVLCVFFQKQNYLNPDIWDYIWKPYQIPLFPDQLMSIHIEFYSNIQTYKYWNEPLKEAGTTL